MDKKTKLLFAGMGFTIVILVLLLAIPDNVEMEFTVSTLYPTLSLISDNMQYEPVVTFKEKYPDYVVLDLQDYPPGARFASIVYGYTNSSLDRIERLIVHGNPADPAFTQSCTNSNEDTFGYRTANLQFFTKKDIDSLKCANYNMDSETLQKLQSSKQILEKSNFPIKKITIDYDDESLDIVLFEFPKDNYEEKINTILQSKGVMASMEYAGFGIVTYE